MLNDLARRLADLHNTPEVLQEVAVRTRQLRGVDVTYIMLRPEGGTLRIEYLDGSLGTALSGAVLDEGEGLGGEVMRAGEPMWSMDYLHDTRVHRVDTVDAAAASEHLGRILAPCLGRR